MDQINLARDYGSFRAVQIKAVIPAEGEESLVIDFVPAKEEPVLNGIELNRKLSFAVELHTLPGGLMSKLPLFPMCHSRNRINLRLEAAVGGAPLWGGIYSAVHSASLSTRRNEFRPTGVRLAVAVGGAPLWGGIYSAVHSASLSTRRNEFRPTGLRLAGGAPDAEPAGGKKRRG